MRVLVVALAALLTVLTIPEARADTCDQAHDSDLVSVTVGVKCSTPGSSQSPGKGRPSGGKNVGGPPGSTGDPEPSPTPSRRCYFSHVDGCSDWGGTNRTPSAEPAASPTATGPQVTEETIREATAQLSLPEADVNVGPDPSVNKWNSVVVGYPLWLWTSGDKQVATAVEAQGIAISMEARRTHTVFEMGDGGKVRCTAMARYSKPVFPNDPPKESPNCGYRYKQLPKKVGAGYTVTVTTHWTVTWTAAGASGELTMTRTGSRHLNIVEIQSVIVAR